jgi:O-succinylbenzoate synthase
MVPGLAASLNARARRVRLPLRRPHRAATGTEIWREVVLVEVEDVAGSGWGECPTLSERTYAGETTDDAWAALTSSTGRPGPMALAAVADARLDAELRAGGRTLGRPGVRLERTIVVGLDTPLEELDGHDAPVKLKITPQHLDRLHDARRRWPLRRLMADANGSFDDPGQLTDVLDEVRLTYLEQPFPAGDLRSHAALRDCVATPIALDESIRTAWDLRAAAAAGAVDLVSIKPARVGGVEAAMRLIEVAAELGVGGFVGGMLETGIGRAAALRVASDPWFVLPTDSGPSRQYFLDDLCDPIEGDDTTVVVPDGPGLGRNPDPDRLVAVTVAESSVRCRFTQE